MGIGNWNFEEHHMLLTGADTSFKKIWDGDLGKVIKFGSFHMEWPAS